MAGLDGFPLTGRIMVANLTLPTLGIPASLAAGGYQSSLTQCAFVIPSGIHPPSKSVTQACRSGFLDSGSLISRVTAAVNALRYTESLDILPALKREAFSLTFRK